MTRRWQIIKVELVSGRGEDLEPPPGRIFVCPTGTTFAGLAHAIDLAFARWDLAHLCEFELADGTVVVDDDFEAELQSSGGVARTAGLSARVKQHLRVGERCSYVFDLGDSWTHECRVVGIDDPEDVLGMIPDAPTAFWGWGDMPDQYGRLQEEDDEPEDQPEPRTDRGAAPL